MQIRHVRSKHSIIRLSDLQTNQNDKQLLVYKSENKPESRQSKGCTTVAQGFRGGELLLLLLLLLLPLIGLLGLRLLDTLRLPLRGGLGEDPEDDDDLPRLATGALPPLLGEIDLDRERMGLRIGDRLRL